MAKRVGMEVSLAIGEAATLADVDVVAAYPITPQTHIVEHLAELVAEAGFAIILTCDSFADSVLEKNGSSYREKDITETIELCEKFSIDCTLAHGRGARFGL